MPRLYEFTLAFALQLTKKHGKTSIRVRKTSVRVRETMDWLGTEIQPSSKRPSTNLPSHGRVLTKYFWLHILTPCSRVLLQKLTGLQLVKKFPTFYGTRRFINAFTSAVDCFRTGYVFKTRSC
jgi:hypothetical protein